MTRTVEENDEKKNNKQKNCVTLTGSCAVCYKTALFFCPECFLVGYCCISHMENHWKTHDELCTVAKRIMSENKGGLFKNHILDDNEWRRARINVIVKTTRLLNRNLLSYERDLLLFPKYCPCYETEYKKLTNCKKCYQVWYCRNDPEHLNKSHTEWCSKIKFYSRFIRYQTVDDIFEINTETFETQPIKLNKNDSISSVINNITNNTKLDDFKTALISQMASGPLTLLYALKQSKYNDYKCKFVVHLIGAEMHYEGNALQAWEYFFLHHLPQLNQLKIIMIGPELKLNNNKGETVRLCSECQRKNKKLIIEYQDGLLYHEYVKNGRYTKPNFVCAFNPGLHRSTGFNQKDTWPHTIKKAVSNKCPFVFTAYTSYEAPLDLARVQECAMVYPILGPVKNPFASLKPDRNFISDHEAPLIYKNYYMTVVSLVV